VRWGNTLQFSSELDEGVIEIDYFKRLSTLELDLDEETIVDSEPDIPAQFHYLYAVFAASRYWGAWGESTAEEQLKRAEFESGKQDLELYMMYQGQYAPFHMKDVLPRRSRDIHDSDDWADEYIEVE